MSRSGGPGHTTLQRLEPQFFSQLGLSWLIFGIFVPTSCQEGPNLTPKSPKIDQFTPNLTATSANIVQLEAKIARDGLQERPTGPPWTPKSTKNVVGLFDFILRASQQTARPRSGKIPKKAPQRASRWPSWPPLGPSWLSRWPS